MSDPPFFLIYAIGGIATFVLVRFFRVRVWVATLLGTAFSLSFWVVWPLFQGGRLGFSDPWFEIALGINGTFCVIFALGGAVIAKLMLESA